MLHRNRRWPLAAALPVIALSLLAAPAAAQDDSEELPPRLVAISTFDVPYADRAKVWSFMRDYFLPGLQLHPKVLNLRVMTHMYGSGASEVIIMREVAEWADINAPCGAPCAEYQGQRPIPEEGSPGYEAFAEARDLFQKYYTNHRDEIYSVIPAATKIEGRVVGTVGPPPEEVASGGGN